MDAVVRSPARGFTLIELMASLAILATLAALAMPLAEMARKRQQEAELRRALWEIRDAIDAYKRAVDDGRIAKRSTDDPGYPADLLVLEKGVDPVRGGRDGPVYFIRRVPRDPFHADPSVPAHLTWGLRSYRSPPDAPKAGVDVYDVFSRAEGVGLNGLPYRQW